MRPKPESPTPPKGTVGTTANASTEFTDTMPERMRRATCSAFAFP